MPFRARFDCLWCGDSWTTRAPGDLEGWAQLCPSCLGRAGSNPFLARRLRTALAERAAAGPLTAAGPAPAPGGAGVGAPAPAASAPAPGGAGVARGAVSASPGRRPTAPAVRPVPAFPDDWFLRRGPFERGPLHDAAWAAELDGVTRWLDAQPLAGRILEPAAGVGFFSPLLAERGELHASDPDGAALDVARQRLVAHRLLAHLHVADAWAPQPPDEPPFDGLVAAFLLGRVRGAGLDPVIATLRGRLRVGGRLAAVDLRPDPAGGAPPGIAWTYHDPDVVAAALGRAGFGGIEPGFTGRFFVTLAASAE